MPDNPSDKPSRFFLWAHRWTVLWVGAWIGLFVLTHTRMPAGLPRVRQGDKIMHLVAFFVLVILGGRAASARGRAITWRWVIPWTLVYVAYAAADEWLQDFVGRTCSFGDWLADAVGVLTAMAILLLYGRVLLQGEND